MQSNKRADTGPLPRLTEMPLDISRRIEKYSDGNAERLVGKLPFADKMNRVSHDGRGLCVSDENKYRIARPYSQECPFWARAEESCCTIERDRDTQFLFSLLTIYCLRSTNVRDGEFEHLLKWFLHANRVSTNPNAILLFEETLSQRNEAMFRFPRTDSTLSLTIEIPTSLEERNALTKAASIFKPDLGYREEGLLSEQIDTILMVPGDNTQIELPMESYISYIYKTVGSGDSPIKLPRHYKSGGCVVVRRDGDTFDLESIIPWLKDQTELLFLRVYMKTAPLVNYDTQVFIDTINAIIVEKRWHSHITLEVSGMPGLDVQFVRDYQDGLECYVVEKDGVMYLRCEREDY